MKKYISICFVVLAVSAISQNNQAILTDPIVKGKVILKIKPNFKSLCTDNNINIKNYSDIIKSNNCKVKKSFSYVQSPLTEKDKYGNKLVDLTTIYELSFDTTISVEKIISAFISLKETEYCQPVYLPQPLFSPNDPASLNGYQYYLSKIKAYQAWDICKGDSNVVIGITDTGVENAHEDLIDNIYYNYNDQIDGIDNDHDGFVDNFRGWDIGCNDNNPEWNSGGTGYKSHGVSMSGLAAARTNNAKGVASPGYSVKFLPVKITDSTGALIRAYEGIVYAAEHGCSIINCSWGGNSPNPFGQDIVNYATFNRNALVIASAGNSNNQVPIYPASLENVLSVGGTTVNDEKWTPENSGTYPYGSSYGQYVDVCAQASQVYYIKENNGYGSNGWGTSPACAIVSSCAGLIKSFFGDSINAIQLGEILRMTCDNIDTVPYNAPYAGMLGRGRVNLYRALTDTLPSSVKFINYNFTSNSNFIKPGDTVQLVGYYINYLNSTQNLTANITSNNTNVHFLQSTNNIGVINKMQTISNSLSPFIFYIDEQSGYDEEITFNIQYTDINYYDIQYFNLTINKSYADIDTNNIKLTLTSNGKLGYNNLYPLQGSGIRYKNSESYLYEGGLVIAQSSTKITSSFISGTNFKILKGIQPITINTNADEQWTSTFSDALSGNATIGLNIKMNSLEWNNSEKSDFAILNYTLYNNNIYNLDSLYAGIYCDWDIVNYLRNKTNYNNLLRIIYSWYTGQTNLYTGIKLLSNYETHHYAFDIISSGNGSINIYDGLTNTELFQALTNNRDSAGNNSNGNDISSLISCGPFNIAAQDSLTISFAIIASNSLYNIEQAAINAQNYWDSLNIYTPEITFSKNNNLNIFPNPSNGVLKISFNSETNENVIINIFDVNGNKLYSSDNIKVNNGYNIITINNRINNLRLNQGIYLLNIITTNKSFSKNFVVN